MIKISLKREERPNCIDCYKNALKTKTSESQKQTALYGIASAYQQFGQNKEALEAFRAYLKKYPDGMFRNVSNENIQEILSKEGERAE